MMLKRTHIAAGLLLAVAVTGCDRKVKTSQGTVPVDSVVAENERLQAQLVDFQKLSAEKDSIMRESRELQQIMDETEREIAAVTKGGKTAVNTTKGGELPASGAAVRTATMTERVRLLVARLKDTEQRLNASLARTRALRAQNTKLDSAAVEYEKTVAQLTADLTGAKQQITLLAQSVDSLRNVNEGLNRDKVALTASIDSLNDVRNTVYYVAGTKDELKKQGVVIEEGGTKLLFIGSRALQPARELPVTAFKVLDARRDVNITLPRPDKFYKVVSRQDVNVLDATEEKKGEFKGEVHIVDPQKFWAASKYLILVEH